MRILQGLGRAMIVAGGFLEMRFRRYLLIDYEDVVGMWAKAEESD
jgi:hypothetical protein